MTTVVVVGNTMAADTLVSRGSQKIPNRMEKIFELRDGSLVSYVGSVASAMTFIEALGKNENEDISLNNDTVVIRLYPDGSVRLYESEGTYLESPHDFYSYGSGNGYALGALFAGASAERAVQIAAELDRSTGGPFTVKTAG